jgi:hypothetical protein
MSVIGRLDDQVENVLITPVKRQQQRTPDEEPRSPQQVPATEAREAEPESERHEADAPLPVWLL